MRFIRPGRALATLFAGLSALHSVVLGLSYSADPARPEPRMTVAVPSSALAGQSAVRRDSQFRTDLSAPESTCTGPTDPIAAPAAADADGSINSYDVTAFAQELAR